MEALLEQLWVSHRLVLEQIARQSATDRNLRREAEVVLVGWKVRSAESSLKLVQMELLLEAQSS